MSRYWTEQNGLKEDLNRNFAIVEYFPYHSRDFDIKLKEPLESQYYGFELVRQAIKNEAIILLMRGQKLWREAVREPRPYQQSGNRIVPHSMRNVTISENNLGKDNFVRIIKALQS